MDGSLASPLGPGPAAATADTGTIVLAVPKGRILDELGPLLARAGIHPAADYADEDSRRLRFETDDPALDVVRVRPFDVATFVAHGAAQIGVCGADVLMEFDYPEIYAPLDLGIGRCRVSVAEPGETAGTDDPARWSRVTVATKYPNIARRHFAAPRRAGGGGAPQRRDGARALARPRAPDRGPGADRRHARRQRAGRDRGDRPRHLPPDRQPHRAEDPARARSAPGSRASAPPWPPP